MMARKLAGLFQWLAGVFARLGDETMEGGERDTLAVGCLIGGFVAIAMFFLCVYSPIFSAVIKIIAGVIGFYLVLFSIGLAILYYCQNLEFSFSRSHISIKRKESEKEEK